MQAPASNLEHVQCLIDCLQDDFSKSEFDIGRTDVLQHHIYTNDHPPHFEQLRRHLTTQLLIIDKQVEEMLAHDVIKPAASPWCSKVMMVKKRDGTICFCINYHKTNDLIK